MAFAGSNSNDFQSEQLRKYLKVSAVAHLMIAVAIFATQTFLPAPKINLQQSIRVDLVGLPDLTKKEMTQIDPQLRDLEKSLSPPVKEKAVPSPKEEVVNSEKTMNLPNSKSKKAKKDNKLQSAIDRIKALEEIEDQTKQARKTLKGNIMSKGSSISGEISEAEETDRYAAKLQEKLRSNWNLPVWLAQQKLSATALILLDSRGRVVHAAISKPSANKQFDDYVLKTIDVSQPFGQPPKSWVGTSIELGFPL
jgi:outer membrane biosynthesis protein TonB